MNPQDFTPSEVIGKNAEFLGDSVTLTRIGTALQILPADTSFAIVIEAIERNSGESFAETDRISGVAPTTQGLAGGTFSSIGAGTGLTGRFIGYLTIGGGQVRILKDGQMIFADNIGNVSAETVHGNIVIGDKAKKYMVARSYPIAHTEGHFESKAEGINAGLNPFLSQLQQGGARVDRKGINTANFAILVFIVLVIIAMMALIFLKHKAK